MTPQEINGLDTLIKNQMKAIDSLQQLLIEDNRNSKYSDNILVLSQGLGLLLSYRKGNIPNYLLENPEQVE